MDARVAIGPKSVTEASLLAGVEEGKGMCTKGGAKGAPAPDFNFRGAQEESPTFFKAAIPLRWILSLSPCERSE